jgi:hypothetical protein
MLIWASHTSAGSDIFEFPIAEIAVERVAAFRAAEIDIHPLVAINIAQRHAGADFQETIRRNAGIGEEVAESDARLASVKEGEASLPIRWDRERGEPETVTHLPNEIRFGLNGVSDKPSQRKKLQAGS